MPSNQRRDYLFEDWTEEEWQDRLTTIEQQRSSRVTNISASTDLDNIAVASGDQLRIIGYKWYMEDGGPTRARLEAVHSTTGFSSIVERDYLHTPGEQEHRGNGFKDPYTTVNFHADGSLDWRVVPESGGAQATITSAAVTMHAARITRIDEGNL